MRRVVWKYHLSRGVGVNVLEMPVVDPVLRVAMQDGIICMWVLVCVDEPKVKRRFSVHGTGHDIPNDACYIDTVMDGPFVWHVFERITLTREALTRPVSGGA